MQFLIEVVLVDTCIFTILFNVYWLLNISENKYPPIFYQDIQPFKKWYTVVEGTKNLRGHLQDSRLLIDETNPIDQKSLKKYYVENNAVLLTDLETWENEEEEMQLMS